MNPRLVKLSQDDWGCAAVCNVFPPHIYRDLVHGFEDLEWHEAAQSFYRQREVNLGGVLFYENLFNTQVREGIAHKVGQFFGVKLDRNFDVAAHKMIAGDFIGVHTDANRFGETHRLTVTMNDGWSIADGGVLLSLNGPSLKNVRDAWLPTANNGFLFEISERSFHAVSPIIGVRPRYSLILTFKRIKNTIDECPTWMPFPLQSDVDSGMSTAAHMGIHSSSFEAPYQFMEFENCEAFNKYVGGHLENAPSLWSYRIGQSMNVDQNGFQSKGPDSARVDAIGQLRRIPPIVVVNRKFGGYTLVDGSHRLSYASDKKMSLGVAVFPEQ